MDAILDKLTEIENAASAIVRHAEEQKDVLGQEFDEKRKKFDEDLENKHALRKSGNSWKKNSREFLTAAAAQVRIRSAASGKNMKRSIQNMRMRY
mgnify:CR=1 FL=1